MNQILYKSWVKKSLIAISIISFVAFGVYAFSASNTSTNVLTAPDLVDNQSELGETYQNDGESDNESVYLLVGLVVVTALVGTFSAFDTARGRKGYKPYYPNSYRKRN